MNNLINFFSIFALFTFSIFAQAQEQLTYKGSYLWNGQEIERYDSQSGDRIYSKPRTPSEKEREKSDKGNDFERFEELISAQKMFSLGFAVGGAKFSEVATTVPNINTHAIQSNNGLTKTNSAPTFELELGVRPPNTALRGLNLGASLYSSPTPHNEKLPSGDWVQLPGSSKTYFVGERQVRPDDKISWNVFAEHDIVVVPGANSLHALSAGVYYGQRNVRIEERRMSTVYESGSSSAKEPGFQVRYRNSAKGFNRFYLLGRYNRNGGIEVSGGAGFTFGAVMPKKPAPKEVTK